MVTFAVYDVVVFCLLPSSSMLDEAMQKHCMI